MTGSKKGPPLDPGVEAFLTRLDVKPADSATAMSVCERVMPTVGRVSIAKVNASRQIPFEESAEVKRVFEEIRGEFPSKTRCYAAIAAKLNIGNGRVRYIIEGSRTKK